MTGNDKDILNDLKRLIEANEELVKQQKIANILKVLELEGTSTVNFGFDYKEKEVCKEVVKNMVKAYIKHV